MKESDFEFVGKTVKEIWFKEMEERNIFLKDEKIIAAIRGTIESGRIPFGGDRSTYSNISLGSSTATHVRDGLIGLTNKRVIFYMPKILNRYEFESYTLDQISSVQFTKGLVKGRIQITAFNDYKTIKWVDNEEGKTITTMIQKAVHDLKFEKDETHHIKSEKSDEDDALKALKLRYAKGEISNKKYEEMKKNLE
jgi:hypothetical protein